MFVYSYLEMHTTLIAWQLYGVVYDVLVSTGLLILPVLWMLISNSVRSAGTEQPDSHETAVVHIKGAGEVIVVLLFCVLPIYPVAPTDIRYQPPADGGTPPAEVDAANDPSSFGNHFGLSNAPVQVPAWWGLLHAVSTGLTNAVIRGLPAHDDLRDARMLLNSRNIEDPGLSQQYSAFLQLCYWPARQKYNRLHAAGDLPEGTDTDWAGSQYLINTPGLYEPCSSGPVCAGPPLALSETLGEERVTALGVGNTCAGWWESIRSEILTQGQEDQGLWDRLVGYVQRGTGFRTEREQEDVIVRQTLENHQLQGGLSAEYDSSTGGFFSDILKETNDLVGTWSLAGQWWNIYNVLSVIKQALPILFAVTSMIFITVIPLALLFSAFRIQGVVRLSFLFFSLIFIHALLAMAGWLDHWLTVSLFEDRSAIEWVRSDDHLFGHAQKRMLIDIILALVYIAMPSIWFMLMGSVGVGAGQFLAGATMATTAPHAIQTPINPVSSAAGSMARGGAASAAVATGKGAYRLMNRGGSG